MLKLSVWWKSTQLVKTVRILRNGNKSCDDPRGDCSMTDDEALRDGGDKERIDDHRDLSPPV